MKTDIHVATTLLLLNGWKDIDHKPIAVSPWTRDGWVYPYTRF